MAGARADAKCAPVEFDKKHSLFWVDGQNQLFILKVKNQDTFILTIFKGDKQSSIFFTGDEFSSLICEVVKYCLDLPRVARKIPCPINLTKKLHGCLQNMEAKLAPDGKGYVLELDERWMEYHGFPKELILEIDADKGAIVLKPKSSKALVKISR